jgi:thioredoxin-like negative regulator of GroEL
MMKMMLLAMICLLLPAVHSLRVVHQSTVVNNMDEFNNVVGNLQIPYVLYFYADWCIPCKTLSPNLSSWEQKSNGKWTSI